MVPNNQMILRWPDNADADNEVHDRVMSVFGA
jgi:hypothetical protein